MMDHWRYSADLYRSICGRVCPGACLPFGRRITSVNSAVFQGLFIPQVLRASIDSRGCKNWVICIIREYIADEIVRSLSSSAAQHTSSHNEMPFLLLCVHKLGLMDDNDFSIKRELKGG